MTNILKWKTTINRVRQFIGRYRSASSATRVWVRKPGSLTNRDICLFVTYSATGRVSEHALVHAAAWMKGGFVVVLIVASDRLSDQKVDGIPQGFDGILVRANSGYDFGAWATAIQDLSDLKTANSAVIVNDSIYGPLSNFPDMLGRMRASKSDLVGAVYSSEVTPHLQSFLILFKRSVVASEAFRLFWKNVKSGGRQFAINRYELRLKRYFEQHGFTTAFLFSGQEGFNPTLREWRQLISSGFPYIKVQLLRDNPCSSDLGGWQDVMERGGYDPNLVVRHLEASGGQNPGLRDYHE